jgi:hypothetical protein
MSISGLAPATHHSDPLPRDFQALGSALQSGNLASAQNALSTFQQALQTAAKVSPTQPFGPNNRANADFTSLSNALQTGNLVSAQKAFASLQADLNATTGTNPSHPGQVHHHAVGPASATAAAGAVSNLNVTA